MREYDRADDAVFVARRDADVDEVVAALRQLVRSQDRTQRSIESQNAFQSGYLSQVLQGHISLSVRHLLGILNSLDVSASAFFAQLQDQANDHPELLLSEVREKMARYDAALDELAEKGILGPTTIPSRASDDSHARTASRSKDRSFRQERCHP